MKELQDPPLRGKNMSRLVSCPEEVVAPPNEKHHSLENLGADWKIRPPVGGKANLTDCALHSRYAAICWRGKVMGWLA
jgi:hypothetical protein